MPSRKRPYPTQKRAEDRMHNVLEDLEAFEKFQQEIAPKLRELVAKGASSEDIYKFAQSMVAARSVTIALMDKDTGRALAAIKEVLDRSQGKATEKHEIAHRYEKLKDEELDSLIESRLNEASSASSDVDTSGDPH